MQRPKTTDFETWCEQQKAGLVRGLNGGYLDIAKEQFGAKQTHALVAAVGIALDHHLDMNRFVVGKRLYQRDGRWVSFSMKRERMNKTAKLAVVKQRHAIARHHGFEASLLKGFDLVRVVGPGSLLGNDLVAVDVDGERILGHVGIVDPVAVDALAALQLPVGTTETMARESVPAPEDLMP